MTTTCPVCRMRIDQETAAAKENYKGQTYYFCSQECADTFKANPEKYARQSSAKAKVKV
jgi:Cu+-exporting ATPase